MDTSQIEEEVERNRRRFFRARSNTGALVAREVCYIVSFGLAKML